MTSPRLLQASKSTRTESEVRAERAGGFTAWLAAKVGPNWVLHRNTTRIRRRYGDDVVRLSNSRYAALVADYERETGRSAHGYVMPPETPCKPLALATPDLLARLIDLESSIAAILASDPKRGPVALAPMWLEEIRSTLAKAKK